jgi:hypothetical protein
MPVPAIDTYSRFYQGLFDDRKIISISKGGLSFFGSTETDEPSETNFIFDQEVFDIDIIRGSKTIAAMIPRGITGEVISDDTEKEQEWTEFNRFFPLAQKKGYINANKLIKRMPGETPYQPFTQAQRLQILAGKQHLSRMRQLMGLQEVLAWLSLLEGKMPAILDTTKDSEIYDFRRNAANIITVSTDWAAATLAEILDDIDDACDVGRENGKVVVDMLLLGRGVWTPLLLKTGIEKYFDLRRINQGTLDTNIDLPPRFNRFTGNGGLEPRGRLVTPKGQELWVFSYNQHYERPKGTVNYFLPEDQALLAYSGARADRYFGPGEVLPRTRTKDMWYEDMFGFTPADLPMPEMTPTGDIFSSMMYHFHAYESPDGKGVNTVTQTAPVYATTQTDAFVTLKGLLP